MSLLELSTLVLALYKTSDNNLRKDYEHRLSQLTSSPIGWEIANSFLNIDPSTSSDNQLLVFYGTQVLLQKLYSGVHELSPANLVSLRSSLLSKISTLCTISQLSPNIRSILRCLCTSLSIVTLNSPDITSKEDILSLLNKLPSSSLDNVFPLIEIIIALPIELNNRRVRISRARYDTISQVLSLMSVEVFQVLMQILKASPSSLEIVVLVFKALDSWVVNLFIPPSVIIGNNFLDACFNSLVHSCEKSSSVFELKNLIETSCDSIHSCVSKYAGSFHDERSENYSFLIDYLLPKLLSLEGIFDRLLVLGSDDEAEEACILARFFSDCSIEYIPSVFIYSKKSLKSTQLEAARASLLRIITKATCHSNSTISSSALDFWKELDSVFYRLSEEEKNILRPQFKPFVLQLADSLTTNLQFPRDIFKWTPDKQDDWKHGYRYDVADVLLACCELSSGNSILNVLATRLQKRLTLWQNQKSGWEPIEATLYAIRSIGRYIVEEETAILPSLFQLIPQLPDMRELKCTSFRLIGRFSKFLKKNPNLLMPNFLMMCNVGLNSDSEFPILPSPLQECVANAMRDVSNDCLPLLVPEFLSLVSKNNLLSMHVDNYSKAIEGVVGSICSLQASDIEQGFSRLFRPIMSIVSSLLSSPTQSLESVTSSGIILSILAHSDGVVRPSTTRDLGGIDSSICESILLTSERNNQLEYHRDIKNKIKEEKLIQALLVSLLERVSSIYMHASIVYIPGVSDNRSDEFKNEVKVRESIVEKCLVDNLSSNWNLLTTIATTYMANDGIQACLTRLIECAIRSCKSGIIGPFLLHNVAPFISHVCTVSFSSEWISLMTYILDEVASPIHPIESINYGIHAALDVASYHIAMLLQRLNDSCKGNLENIALDPSVIQAIFEVTVRVLSQAFDDALSHPQMLQVIEKLVHLFPFILPSYVSRSYVSATMEFIEKLLFPIIDPVSFVRTRSASLWLRFAKSKGANMNSSNLKEHSNASLQLISKLFQSSGVELLHKVFQRLLFDWPTDLVLSRHTPPTLRSVRCLILVVGQQNSGNVIHNLLSTTSIVETDEIKRSLQILSSQTLAPHVFEDTFQSLVSSIRYLNKDDAQVEGEED
jgi:hypothetical protein